MTPLCDAYMDSIPMVVITGQVPVAAIGTDAFQECDTIGITRSVTKHNELVTSAADIPRAVREAFHIATTGRPGPVLLDIPKDIVDPKNPNSHMEWHWPSDDEVRDGLPGYKPTLAGHPRKIREAADMILRSERPVIYAGGGILGLVDPGDEVIVPDPGYPIYESLTRFVGATPVGIPIRMERDFRLDVDELASLITPRTRVLFINSPANPTGGVLTRDDLTRIAALAEEHDLWVVSDEIYGRILYDGHEHVSIAALPGMAERTIILDGFSKTFAMTGWRMGYAVVPDALIPTYQQLIINTISCAPTFVQVGAVQALTGPQDDVEAMVVEFKARRDLVVAGLNDIPGIRCATPVGAFYAFPDISGTGMTGRGTRRGPARRRRRVCPGRDGVRGGRHGAHPDQLRQLAREPDRGAGPDPRLRGPPRPCLMAPGRGYSSRGASPTRGWTRSAPRASWTSGTATCRRHATNCCVGSPGSMAR